ncbi:MAG: PilZ domain-containing protein [Deltaproteobacteria bacterium]|nr:MAG: PilZ domain-containing protein [Deltaproteobacteria bacterium]
MNRRRFIRHFLECPVTVATPQGTMSGQARNLSGDGALICCQQPLDPREGMDLTIEFSDGFSLEVPSEVVWSYKTNSEDEKNLYKMGVRFLR